MFSKRQLLCFFFLSIISTLTRYVSCKRTSSSTSAGKKNANSADYDYIIIGAGACGAVLATRLAEQGQKVLVVETGEDEHLNPLTRWGYFFPNAAYSHLYRNYFTEPEIHVKNRRLYHQAAKALGGGTAVNAMVWTWGDPRDWDLINLPNWTYEEVLPYFIKSENYTGAPALDSRGIVRGQEGPITLSSFKPNSATSAAVKTASEVFQVPVETDNNGGVHESAAIVQRNFKGLTIDTGTRMGTFMAYLRPAMAKYPEEILEVATRSTVLQLLLKESPEGGGLLAAQGVRYLRDGVCQEASARYEVILAAGAYNTPKILQLSGVGDCTHLGELGIDCLVSSPAVGRNLVDHINPGSLLFTGPPRRDYDANIVAAYTRTGVVPDELTPDVELGFIVGPPVEDPESWDKVPALYVFYSLWLLNGALGSISLKSKDPLEDPVIVSGYLRTPTDEKKLVKIFRMLITWSSHFAKTTGLRLQQQPTGGNAIKVDQHSTDDEILREAKTVLSTHWHAAQSCRMGVQEEDPDAVVDTKFNFLGIDRLRVVDASSQPVLTNGHPMAVLVMMAERAAEWIAEDREKL